MQTLEKLQRRIRTAEDIRAVVTTMKGLAAVSIRQYERAADALADYDRTVQLALRIILREHPPREESRDRAGEGGIALVLGSDQGMCGPFNDAMADFTGRELAPGKESWTLLAVGQRIAGLLEAAGRAPAATFGLPGTVDAVAEAVWDVLLAVRSAQERTRAGKVVVLHNTRTGPASYEARRVDLLPLDRAWFEALTREPWPTRMLPQFQGEPERLFSALVQEYLFVSLYRAMAESLASENASRLASMQAAERNIEERLDDLNGDFRSQRQQIITAELQDIMAGFEALA